MFKILVSIVVLVSGICGQLRVEDVSEGPCMDQATLQKYLYQGVNAFALIKPDIFYVPMGNQVLYRHYAEALLARPANDQAELDAMQLHIWLDRALTNCSNYGYSSRPNPPSLDQACVPVAILGAVQTVTNVLTGPVDVSLNQVQALCPGMIARNGAVITKSFVSPKDSLLWANEDASVLLIHRCPSDNIQDWKVFTRSKTLTNQTIINIVKNKITSMGFSLDKIAYANYD